MTGKTTKTINTSNRSRIIKPTKAMGDQPPSTGQPIGVIADKDRAPATTMKSMAAKAKRTKGSAGL